MYNTISNIPKERQRVLYPWCYWDNAFNADELAKMCEYFANAGVERGTTVGQKDEKTGEIKQESNESVRKSNVKFHDFSQETMWIYNRINWVIQQINEQFYNFNLNGYDTFQYTEYESDELGRYDFHMDTIMGKNIPGDMIETRKLSMSLLLNEQNVDFEGGEFQINNGQEKDAETVPLTKGRMVFFPSFMLHRVAPVTKGKRKSLVVWVTGPKFV